MAFCNEERQMASCLLVILWVSLLPYFISYYMQKILLCKEIRIRSAYCCYMVLHSTHMLALCNALYILFDVVWLLLFSSGG